MPNPYVNKVTVNNATIIDLTADTAIASDVANGKYFHLASGERVVGTASGGGDASDEFVVTLTIGQDDLYYPDCTYAEAVQALYENKDLVLFAGDDIACDYERDVLANTITYHVSMVTDDGSGVDTIFRLEHLWSLNGVSFAGYQMYKVPSGSQTITTNDTYDVTNLAEVVVNVPTGGSSMNVQTAQSTTRVANTAYTKTASLTCSKTGTYDVYWDCFRSSISGTSGSQLHIGGSTYGSANTTFSNHAQTNHLTGVQISTNQEVAVYVRSRATNYYAYCGQLTIIQTA